MDAAAIPVKDDDADSFFSDTDKPGAEDIPPDTPIMQNLKRAMADAKTMGNATPATQLQKSIDDLVTQPAHAGKQPPAPSQTRQSLATVVNGTLWLEH